MCNFSDLILNRVQIQIQIQIQIKMTRPAGKWMDGRKYSINLLLRNCHPYDDHDQKGTTQSKWRSARKLSPKPATSSSFPRLLKRQSRCCCISNNGKIEDHSQVCKSPLVKDCSVRVSPQCKILSQV